MNRKRVTSIDLTWVGYRSWDHGSKKGNYLTDGCYLMRFMGLQVDHKPISTMQKFWQGCNGHGLQQHLRGKIWHYYTSSFPLLSLKNFLYASKTY